MKKSICLLASITIFNSSPALADVKVELPDALRVVAMNGSSSNVSKSVTLPDGTNQIVVRVIKDVGKRFDSEMEYSDAYVIKFSAQNETLELLAPKISNVRDIRAFNRDPKLELISKDKTKIHFDQDKLEKSGLQFIRNFEEELAVFNTTSSPASLQVPPGKQNTKEQLGEEPTTVKKRTTIEEFGSTPTESNSTPPSVQPVVQPKSNEMAEDMLKYWYEQADDETRKKFKEMINQ